MVNTHPHKLSDAARKSRIHKAVNQVPLSIAASSPHHSKSVTSYHQDLQEQSKRISQLLAYSWMSDEQGEEVRNRKKKEEFSIPVTEKPSTIANTLQYHDSEDIKKMFKSQANVDLDTLLGPEVVISVDWNTFDGSIENSGTAAVMSSKTDSSDRTKWWYTFNVPYPPKPDVVESWQLEEWVVDTGDKYYAPPHPYIPLCSGS